MRIFTFVMSLFIGLGIINAQTDNIITEAPKDCSSTYYYRHVVVTANDGEGNYETFNDHGYLTEIASNDSVVYLRDPITMIPTQSYIKGYRDGNDIIFPMPQTVFSDEGYSYTVRMMTPLDWSGIKEEPSDEDFILQIDDDNNLVQKEGNGMLGLFFDDVWAGEAETQYFIEVFNDAVNSRPLNVNYEEWNLIANGNVTNVNVAISGNKVWIENIYNYIQDSCIEGTIEGDKVYFPTAQFLGIDFDYNYFTYFMAARKVGSTGTWDNYEFIDGPLVFDYDKANKEMVATDSYLINSCKEEISYIDNFDAPIIRAHRAVSKYGEPLDPVFTKFVQFNPSWNFGAVYFDIPKMDNKGNVLDTDQMAYNFYINGEIFTFRQSEVQLLLQDYVNVPYELNNYFEIQGGTEERHGIFFKQTVESVGVRSIFAESADESTWHYSNYVQYPPVTEGTDVTIETLELISTKYYDLSGREIKEPCGATIRIDTFSNGIRTASKIIQHP